MSRAKRFRISVGIAAYNAEANIGRLLEAIASQRQDLAGIEEIVVHSDQSTDETVAIVRRHSDPRVVLIENPCREGFAGAVRTMLAAFKGDAIVLLNDDIRITDSGFIERLALPILCDDADLAGANLQPLSPRTLVERGFVSTFRVYERIGKWMPESNGLFTFDGAAMALSPRLARAIDFPKDLAEMGNVDAFLFLSCAGGGFRYVHVPNAVAWFRSPSTLEDYLRRNLRNNRQKWVMMERFGPAVSRFFEAPAGLYWESVVIEMARHPLASGFVFFAGLYMRFRGRSGPAAPSPTWEVLDSSKKLD
jgi:glycosyltransferase involved in cell wall biosynthesis